MSCRNVASVPRLLTEIVDGHIKRTPFSNGIGGVKNIPENQQ